MITSEHGVPTRNPDFILDGYIGIWHVTDDENPHHLACLKLSSGEEIIFAEVASIALPLFYRRAQDAIFAELLDLYGHRFQDKK